MPESKWEQIRRRNQEVAHFLKVGDARGPGWLADHPGDRQRALWTLETRSPEGLGLIPDSSFRKL